MFEVNLFDYLDTGLFLDHRPTRASSARRARQALPQPLLLHRDRERVRRGRRRGVDHHRRSFGALPRVGRRNLAINGFDDAAPARAGRCAAWLEAEAGTYDSIFCDPPTFSNSKRAEDFDVQRDHVRLIQARSRACRRRAHVFSNNFRQLQTR